MQLLAILTLLAIPQDSPTQDLPALLDATVEEAIQDPAFVGLSVAVALDDELLFAKGYGLAEAEHDVPVNTETIFRIGSITKQFTAAAVCQLVETFDVDLDEDMNVYVPDFPTLGHTVTVRHLLTHTSGIPSYTSLGEEWSRTVPLELSHDELLGFVKDRPFDFAPGSAFLYNNTGYYLLGVLLENVTETEYGALMQERFFGPLGMDRPLYASNARLIRNRAQGYRFLDGELSNDRPIGLSQPGAAGALASTASDLVRWEIALRTGKVVEPATFEEMTLPFLLESAEEAPYGFGLFLGERGGVPSVYHGGGINGFNTMLAHYPEQGLTIATLSNSESFDASQVELTLAAAVRAAR